MNYPPLINGKAFEWADVSVIIMGVPIVGIDAVKYDEAQEMTNNYGAGNKPVSRGYGQIKCEASLTLHVDTINQLMAKAPNGKLNNIPEFDVVVSWIQDTGGTMCHTLKMCRFMKNSVEVKGGDTKVAVEVPLIVGDIIWK